MTWRSILLLAFFIGISLAAGAIGSIPTMSAVGGWYAALAHPAWTPPNWVFGPVWTTLYVLMGTSAYLVMRSRGAGRFLVLWLFFAHLVVNALWSIVFFGFHELGLSVGIIVLLWALVALLMRLYWRYSRLATYLMIPYLLWVTYASTLAIGLLALN